MLRFRRTGLGLSSSLPHSPIDALRVRVLQKTLRELRAYVSVAAAAHNVPQTPTSRYTSYAEQVVQNQRLLYAQHLRAFRRDTAALHDAQHAEAKLVQCARTNGNDTDVRKHSESVKEVHSATGDDDDAVFVSSAERRLMAELGVTDLMAQEGAEASDTKRSETNSETEAELQETTISTTTTGQQLDRLRPRIAALCHAGLRARIVPTSIVHSILDSCALNTNNVTKRRVDEAKDSAHSSTTTRTPIDFTAYLTSPAETTRLVRALFSDDIVAALLEAMIDYLHYTRHRMHTQQLRQTFVERPHSTTSPNNSSSSDVMMTQMLQQEQRGEVVNKASSYYAVWRQDAARERVARQLLQLFQPVLRDANTDGNTTKDTPVAIMCTVPDTARRRLCVAAMRLAAVLGEAEYAAQLMQDVFTGLERITTQQPVIPSHSANDEREDTAMEVTSSWQLEEVRAMCLSAIEASLVALQTQLVLNSTSTTIASTVEATMKESARQSDAFAHSYALFMRYMQWRRQGNSNDEEEEDNTQRHASASGSLHDTLLLFPEDTMAFITMLAPCVGRADDVVSLRTLCTLFTELLTLTEVGYSEESSEAVKKAYSALLASFADLTAPFAPHDLRRTQLSLNNRAHKSQSVTDIVENEQCAEDACLALLENLVKTTVQNSAMSVSQDTQVTAQLMRVFAHGGHVTRALLLFNKLAAPSTRMWAMREEMVGSMLLTTSLTTLQPSTHSGAYVVAVVKCWRESFARYRSFRAQHYALTSNIIHGLIARMLLLVVESAMPAEALQERRAMLYTMLDDGLSTCEDDKELSVMKRSALVDLYAGRTFFLRCLVFLQSLVCTLKDNSRSAVAGQDTTRFTHGCNVLHAWYTELMSQHEAEEHLTWPLVELFCHLAQTLKRVCGDGAQRILRDMERDILHRYVRRFTTYVNSGMSNAQRSESCLLDVEELQAMCTSDTAQSVKTEVIFVHSDTTRLSATKYVQHSRRAEAGSLLRAAWSTLMSSTPDLKLTNGTSTTEQQSTSNASSPSACPTRPMYVITLHDYAQLCLLQTWLRRVDSVSLAHAEQAIASSDKVRYRVLSPEAERVLRGRNVSDDKMNKTAAVCDDSSTAAPLGVRSVTWQSLLQSYSSTPLTVSEKTRVSTAPLPTLDLSEKDSVAYWLREWIACHSVCVSGLDFFTRSVRRGLKEADALRLSQYAAHTMNAAEAETAYAALAKGSPFVDVDQVLSDVA